MEETELELLRLFKSIDRDHNEKLDRDELRLAFEKANIAIDSGKLNGFFDKIDTNHDGEISFDEWRWVEIIGSILTLMYEFRNFLMFLPATSTDLKAVLSYYSSYVLVNPEGDVHVSDEANQGIGTSAFLHTLFGVLFFIANQHTELNRTHGSDSPSNVGALAVPPYQATPSSLDRSDIPWDPGEREAQSDMAQIVATFEVDSLKESALQMLTALLPDPGYFLAGGVAGAVSRTATAPLDRLKVYLIAQTGVARNAVDAVKSGAPVQAAKSATAPLINATAELWRMGGVRSLFAGKWSAHKFSFGANGNL